ncbi:MAG: hypothetical protein NC081_08160 [Roseburia sp.]|nr:hypothetical protein [Roseburia sp.]
MKSVKKSCLGIAVAVMLMGCSFTTFAATPEVREIHNYEDLGERCVNTVIYHHTHYTGGPNGTTIPMDCTVMKNEYKNYKKCHCGAEQWGPSRFVETHSVK